MATNDKKTNGSDVNNVGLNKSHPELQKHGADIHHRRHAVVEQLVLANFKQVVKQARNVTSNDVRIHPMVARQVDPELLKKMGAAVDSLAT